jgi:hypothetical protein
VYIHPSVLIFQSQSLAMICANSDSCCEHSTDSVMPMDLLSGSQKTLNP